jgi:hypothetical protein
MKYDNLVIGGSFEAVLFAFKEGYPILYKDLEKPYIEETFDNKSKKDVFDMMLFLLSMSNLNSFGGTVADIRYENDKIIVSGHRPWIFEIEAKTVHDFTTKINKNKLRVVDLFRLKNAGIHELTSLSSGIKLAKEINIVTGTKRKQFVEVVSYLSEKESLNEEYSQIYSMLEAKKALKEAGLKGKKKGIESRKGFVPGQRYRGFALQFIKRDVFKQDKTVSVEAFNFESKDPYIQKLVRYINEPRKSTKSKKFSLSWNNTSRNTIDL